MDDCDKNINLSELSRVVSRHLINYDVVSNLALAVTKTHYVHFEWHTR